MAGDARSRPPGSRGLAGKFAGRASSRTGDDAFLECGVRRTWWRGRGRPSRAARAARGYLAASAEAAVTALYAASALGLIRMAYVMLGDLPSAEDVVQEAFCGLYRRWDRLASTDGALYYVRTSV